MIDKLRNNFLFLSCGVGLFVAVLFCYGLIPGLYVSSLSSYYAMAANTDCILNQGILTLSYCGNYGLNLGFPFLAGLPFIYTSALIASLLNVTSYTANILTGSLFVLLSFLSMYYLLKKLDANRYIAIFAAFLFLSLSFNYGHASYSYLMYNFLLLPFYLLVDHLCLPIFFSRTHKLRTTSGLCLAYAATKTFALFMDGYGFMISSLVSVTYVVFLLLRHRKDKMSLLAGASCFGVSYAIAVILYKKYVPFGATYAVMPIDFFRAQGIDLISLFVPGHSLLFANVAKIAKTWNGFAYFGDSSNVKFNYLGYSLTSLFVLFLFFVRRKAFFAKVIIVAGVAALFLSLGPSLKINDHKVSLPASRVSFSDYLMPKAAATLDLHTDFIYQKIPGIKNMRAVYRWLLLFKFALVIGAALFLSFLLRRSSYLIAILLIIFTAMEMLPDFRVLQHDYRQRYHEMVLFNSEVLPALAGYVQDSEKIYYLSHENDFLANYISAKLKVRSYNCGGDKNRVLSSRYQPESVLNMTKGHDVADNAFQALRSGAVDKIVIPYFNLRWNSYYWPPSDNDIASKKNSIDRLFDGDNRFKVRKSSLFEVLQLKSNRPFVEQGKDALLPEVDFTKADYHYVTGLYQYEKNFRWSGVHSAFWLAYYKQRYLHIHVWIPKLENYGSKDVRLTVRVNDTVVKSYRVLRSGDIDDTIALPAGVISGNNAVVSLAINKPWKVPKGNPDRRALAFVVKQVGFTDGHNRQPGRN